MIETLTPQGQVTNRELKLAFDVEVALIEQAIQDIPEDERYNAKSFVFAALLSGLPLKETKRILFDSIKIIQGDPDEYRIVDVTTSYPLSSRTR